MSRFKFVGMALFGLAGAVATAPASAAIGAPEGLRAALEDITAIENVQYVWRGQQYCWYEDGWRGPGWYRCGYHLRRGFGWGGPMGWRGWRGGEYRERREFRRGMEDRELRRGVEGRELRRGMEGRELRRGMEGRELRRGTEGRELRRGGGVREKLPEGGR
jgi:hypothetical protein